MKSTSAFVLGLWVGGIIGGVVLYHLLTFEGNELRNSSKPQAQVAEKLSEIEKLQRDLSRLQAETYRLKETITDVTGDFNGETSPYDQAQLYDEELVDLESELPDAYGAEEVLADVQTIDQLYARALEDDEIALEAIALRVEDDGGETLAELWKSSQINFNQKINATRYLAATLEISQHAQDLLGSLFVSPESDSRLIEAAIDGLVNPSFDITPEHLVLYLAPPHFDPDYRRRLLLLEQWSKSFTDPQMQTQAAYARQQLRSHMGHRQLSRSRR